MNGTAVGGPRAGTGSRHVDEDVLDARGSGDVVGPSSAVLGHLAVFGDTTGKVLADGGAPSGGGGGAGLPASTGANKVLLDNGDEQDWSDNPTFLAWTFPDVGSGAHDPVNDIRVIPTPDGYSLIRVLSSFGAGWGIALMNEFDGTDEQTAARFPDLWDAYSSAGQGEIMVPSLLITWPGVPLNDVALGFINPYESSTGLAIGTINAKDLLFYVHRGDSPNPGPVFTLKASDKSAEFVGAITADKGVILPSSDPHVANAIWNNGGAFAVSAG